MATPIPLRTSLPPAITIHSLEHAKRALTIGRPVTLLSAPAAAVYAGPAWWRALLAACDTVQPDMLDCADAPGRALEAIALGCQHVVLLPCPAWASVADRAAAAGAILLTERPPSLDCADPAAPARMAARIAAWLEVG